MEKTLISDYDNKTRIWEKSVKKHFLLSSLLSLLGTCSAGLSG
jgi:hypothetical protein